MRDPNARLRRLPPPQLRSAAAALRRVVRPPRGRRAFVIDGIGGVALVGAALILPTAIVATPTSASASLVASPSSVAAGNAIAVDGSGFERRATGTIVLDTGTTEVRFQANGRGSFSVTLPVPSRESGGQHPVTATNGSGSSVARTSIYVIAQLGASSPPAAGTAVPTDLVTLDPTLGPTPFSTF